MIGAVVALLPLLGFPRAWEAFFQVLAGFLIITLSVWSGIDKKISLKAKAQMRHARRRVSDIVSPLATEVEIASSSEVAAAKRHTDFYPKTGQPGRRVSDLKPTSPEEELN